MKLLITDSWKSFELYKHCFSNHEITFLSDSESHVSNPEQFDIVICNNLFKYNDIKKFTNLKLIQTTSTGLDKMPLDYLHEKNIDLMNVGNAYSIPIAEYVLSVILYQYKNINFFEENKKSFTWCKCRGLTELYQKNVLIFGCGNIGCEIAKRLNSFNAKCFGIDICKRKSKYFKSIKKPCDAKYIIPKADIIISCLPLTDKTKHYFSEDVFAIFKTKTLFINVSRGAVVCEEDLVSHLGKNIDYAILDVFENEPLPKNSVLWQLKNVFISPHNSFEGEHNNLRVGKIITRNVCNWIKQQR